MGKYRVVQKSCEINGTKYYPQKRCFLFWWKSMYDLDAPYPMVEYPVSFLTILGATEYIKNNTKEGLPDTTVWMSGE